MDAAKKESTLESDTNDPTNPIHADDRSARVSIPMRPKDGLDMTAHEAEEVVENHSKTVAESDFPPMSTADAIAGIAVMIIAIVTLLSLPIPWRGAWVGFVGDSVHGPLFAGATYVILKLAGRTQWAKNAGKKLKIAIWVAVPIGMVLLGGGMELVQSVLGRWASWGDAGANAIGVMAGWLWAVSDSQQKMRWRIILRLLAAICLIFNAWRIVQAFWFSFV